ncbi:TetR/AcrR family transcriptional regulator [Pseudonocardia sp. ICBG1293]|uniref:TetR/AcrR family transcriptional regulator n=1 Tax=Pseudonocardia sp. ICBG1293 TaxID=2844382 RepID=UPI001CCFA719|nr:TetR/AcrR family transcriptional regulator [Pseudonocardia sp. ICBG1293]
MGALRSDARRSRQRILDVARGHDRQTLRHNDLAREAGVGVATVYRHFPTTQALLEALAHEALIRLDSACTTALARDDPWDALVGLIDDALTLQLQDDGLQSVLVGRTSDSPEIRQLTADILAMSDRVVRRAHDAGVLEPTVTAQSLQHLVCGIEHAIRIGVPDDRRALQAVLLHGIRPHD